MVIASLYPTVESKNESNSIFDWGFIRELQREFGETPHDYHVFLPYGVYPPDPLSIGKNVYIRNTTELTDFFQEVQVDIWHDFGYTDASDLISLRQQSGQNFPITIKAELPFLANAELTTYTPLSNSDVLICSRPSTHKLIETTHSHLRASDTEGRTYPQICTIPYGVKPERIDSDKKQDARHLLNLPKEATIIFCSVDFGPNSSIDIFPVMQAFQSIAAEKKDVLLIISSSDEEGYVARASEFLNDSALSRQVLFLPNVDESARLLLLAAADIFISPADSVYADNGHQVLEAMARGLPVITTDDEEHGYIDHSKTGFKVKKECLPLSYESLRKCLPFTTHRAQSLMLSQGVVIDVQQIIEYLTLLVESVPLRERIGAAALQYVSEHHDLTKIMSDYEHLWSNVRRGDALTRLETSEAENQSTDSSWLSVLLSSVPQTIDENTPLYITHDGEALLETQDIMVYEEINELIFVPVILEILKSAQSGTCLSKVADSVLGELNPDKAKEFVPNVAYHIMWCMKQGWIYSQIAGGGKGRDSQELNTSNSIKERNNLCDSLGPFYHPMQV